MKKYLALGALVVAGALSAAFAVNALVDDSPKPKVAAEAPAPTPDNPPQETQARNVASKWAKAMSNHQWAAACSLESPTYAGPGCPGTYEQNFAVSQMQLGFDLVKNLHVVSRVVKTAGSETFRAVGPNLDGAVLITVERQANGRWMVANTAGE